MTNKNNHMKPKYWAIFILFAIAAGAGALYWANQPVYDSSPVVGVKHKSKIQPSISTMPETDIKGWKIYTDSQLGFSFQYPEDWKVSYDSSDQTILINEPEDDLGEGSITISKNKQTKQQFISEIKNDLDIQITEQVMEQYNGLNWSKITAKEKTSGKSAVNYFYESNGDSINIVYFDYSIQATVAKKVLSTFKFTK